MPNTTNFNWPTPADTDLVKDGAAAIRNLGNGIDTSLIDLKGGTTGQILSKASNADMDFTFITPNVGDITEVQAGTGISVASGTGPIPVVTNSMATEITAKGDLIVGTGSGTFDNLPVGTNGYTLVADSSVSPTGLKWAAPAGGGKVLQVVQGTTTTAATSTTTTWADTNLSASITPSSATSKVLILVSQPLQITRNADGLGGALRLLRGSTYIFGEPSASAPYLNGYLSVGGATAVNFRSQVAMTYLDSPSTTSSTTYKTQFAIESTANSGTARVQESSITASIILMEIGA